MLWLWEVFTELAEAAARGDKSWWPFIFGVLGITAIAIAVVIAVLV